MPHYRGYFPHLLGHRCGLCTGLAAFALGVAKSNYTDQTPTIESGGLVTLNLLLAGAAAYLVGSGLGSLVAEH